VRDTGKEIDNEMLTVLMFNRLNTTV